MNKRDDVPPSLSIVIPCFNEKDVLPETIKQLSALLDRIEDSGLIDASSHLLLVDDGSKDETWSIIVKSAKTPDSRVKGLKLARNRGHQNALIAGLENAEADIIVSIDADLQDDIEVIEKMVKKYHEGNDIVYGVRASREKDTKFKRLTAEGYYWFLRKMGVDIIFNHADFRLTSRRVIEALKRYEEVNLFLRGIIPTIGFPSTTVEYDRASRVAGESKYPVRKMISLAIDGITSFSPVPLRLIAGLGFMIFLFSMLISAWALGVRIFTDEAVPGWASSVLPMYILGGIQLLSLGVIGEYIAKIYSETKKRPRYFVEEETQ